ncbi:MAG: 3-hydroxyacyl-CoA dehydrogenase family protein, partial [Firmicutes bacterium]|nr:3-hydroxyacyl-CoA dehydrogenase family protein [Bacillota bacterium]
IAARIVACLVNEALFAMMEGVASPGAIDRAMELGTGFPRGPLAWADRLGPAFVLGVLTALQTDTGEERYRPALLLRRLVQAGRTVYGGGAGGR